jgi:predicted transcriptional regulator
MKPSKSRQPFKGISDAELAVLDELWKKPAGPIELQERLARRGPDWAYTTVQTLLHRMLEKGFVSRKKVGVTQVYSARLDRDELLARHVADLADRLCDGAMSPLLLSLVKTKRFSRAELARFRALLEESE